MNSDDMERIASQIRSRIAANPDLQKWVNERLGGVTDEHGTSQRSRAPVCDFCNKAISKSDMHVVNGAVVEKATAGGYLPKNLPAHYQGLDREGQLTAWRMCVRGYSGAEWGICAPCHADLLAHKTKTVANAFNRPQPGTPTDSATAKTSAPDTQTSTKASGVAADTDRARTMAVMRVLIAIARADGVIDEREKVILRGFVSKLGVTRDEFQRLAKEKAHVNIAHLPVDHAERLALLVDVFSLALADSVLAGEEKTLVERLAKSLEIGPGELDGCLQTARARIVDRGVAPPRQIAANAKAAEDRSSSKTDDPERMYTDALKMFNEKRFREAADLLEKARHLNAGSAPIHFTLGATYSRIAAEFGDDDAAVLPWLKKSAQAFQGAIDLAGKTGGLSDHQLGIARNAVASCAPFMRSEPGSLREVVLDAPKTSKNLVDLPSPATPESLEEMESQITQTLDHLAENSNLLSILTSPLWGWNPAEIREKDSARQARILTMTKLGSILGQHGRRLSDATFRMRFSHADNSWDRDFGQPSSVVRIEIAAPEVQVSVGTRWHPGVTVGKVTANRFLIWEWGE